MKSRWLFLFLLSLTLTFGFSLLIHAKSKALKPKTLSQTILQVQPQNPFTSFGTFLDSSGNIVIYGKDNSSNNPVIIKVDPNGGLQWSKIYTVPSDGIYLRLAEDSSGYILATSKNGDGFYIAKVDKSNGSLSGLVKIDCTYTYLPIDDLKVIGSNIYVTGAGNCGVGNIQGAFVIWFDSNLSTYSGCSYTLPGLALKRVVSVSGSDIIAYGHMLSSGIGKYSIATSNCNMTVENYNLSNSILIDAFNNFLLVYSGSNYVVVNVNTNQAIQLPNSIDANNIHPTSSGLIVSGMDLSTNKAVFIPVGASLNVSTGASYTAGTPSYGLGAFPISGGYILTWSGSTYIAFSDSSLAISGFSGYSSYTASTQPILFNISGPTNITTTPFSGSPTSITPQQPTDYPVTISTVYPYTPPSGGGGGGPVIIPPPIIEPPPTTEPPPPPPPPPENTIDIPATTIDGQSIIINAQVPQNEAKITSAEFTPPAQCPTPSTFVPVFGGVSFTIEPVSSSSGTLSIKQSEKFSTTLTITYDRDLSPKAKVFACTNNGCVDITSSSIVEGRAVRIRVEDGSILDRDGVVNGQVETKSLVYAVVPEEYRKSGGCSMGSSRDISLISMLMLPLLVLLRRLGFRRVLAVILIANLSSFADEGLLQKHLKEGEYEEAHTVLEELIKTKGLSEDRSLLRSYILLKMGMIKEAIKQLENDLQFIPSDKLRLRLAYLYGLDGDTKRAWSVLEKVKDRGDTYQFTKGHLHMLEGQYTKAKYALLKVKPSSEYYAEAQFYLSQIYSIEGDTYRLEKGIEELKKNTEYYIHGQNLRNAYLKRKKFNLNFSLGSEYDTNLLGTFELETKIKTWKYFTSLSASYEGDSFRARTRAYLSSNEKGSSYNINYYSFELEPRVGLLSFPAKFDYITLGGDFYASISQIGLGYRSNYGTAYISIGYQDYLSQAFNFENRDGYFLKGGYQYEYLSDKLYSNLELFVRYTNAKGKNWDSASAGLQFLSSYAVIKNLSIGLRGTLEGYNYMQENQAFLKKRRDAFVSFSPFVSFSFYKNFSLILGYTHMRNLSTINYYAYKRNLYSFQLFIRF